jgi:hypothetical protein
MISVTALSNEVLTFSCTNIRPYIESVDGVRELRLAFMVRRAVEEIRLDEALAAGIAKIMHASIASLGYACVCIYFNKGP